MARSLVNVPEVRWAKDLFDKEIKNLDKVCEALFSQNEVQHMVQKPNRLSNVQMIQASDFLQIAQVGQDSPNTNRSSLRKLNKANSDENFINATAACWQAAENLNIAILSAITNSQILKRKKNYKELAEAFRDSVGTSREKNKQLTITRREENEQFATSKQQSSTNPLDKFIESTENAVKSFQDTRSANSKDTLFLNGYVQSLNKLS